MSEEYLGQWSFCTGMKSGEIYYFSSLWSPRVSQILSGRPAFTHNPDISNTAERWLFWLLSLQKKFNKLPLTLKTRTVKKHHFLKFQGTKINFPTSPIPIKNFYFLPTIILSTRVALDFKNLYQSLYNLKRPEGCKEVREGRSQCFPAIA